jgi:hypothetical protein
VGAPRLDPLNADSWLSRTNGYKLYCTNRVRVRDFCTIACFPGFFKAFPFSVQTIRWRFEPDGVHAVMADRNANLWHQPRLPMEHVAGEQAQKSELQKTHQLPF